MNPKPAWATIKITHSPHPRRKNPGVMNKTEEAYAWVLEAQKRAGLLTWYGYEVITLKLADGVRYTPDFAVRTAEGQLEFHEVKGYMREDARIKLRVAAKMFPFKVLLVRKSGRGGWEITEIK